MINPSDIQTSAHIPNSKTKILTKLIQLPLVGTLLYITSLLKRKTIENLFCTEYFYDKNNISERDTKVYYEAAHIGNAESKICLQVFPEDI